MSATEAESKPLHGDLYALVAYLHATCNRDLLDAIQREELSLSQLRLLERLRDGRMRPTVRQAAALMHVSPAAASRAIASLAKRGLIRRQGDDDDFRAKRLVITERGEAVISRLHAVRLEHIQAFCGELEHDEREPLERALKQLLEREPIRAFRPLDEPA